MKKYAFIALLLGIILLGFFLRFYKLGQVPPGMDSDETSIGYNAYSILLTGKDEYGKFMPLYFQSFGDQKLPVYIYLTTASIKLFGLNSFAVRFPSALLGSLTVIIFYFLLLDISKKKTFALIGSLLLALNPWHLFFSRAALEDNVALFFAVLGTFLFVRTVQTKKGFLLSLSVMSFMASFYSYNVTRLLSPMLLFMLVIFYRKNIFSFSKRILFAAGFCFIALLLPFLITLFSAGGVSSAKTALITSTDITAQYIAWRSYLSQLPGFFIKVMFNRITFLVWQYLQNVISFLSPSFFFVTGAPSGNPGIGNYGEFYLFEFPTIIAGFVLYFKNRTKFLTPFFLWFIIALLVASLSKTVPHVTRGYFLLLPLSVFSAYGFYFFVQWIWEKRNKLYTPITFFCVAFIVVYSLSFYFTSYYIRFPIQYASEWTAEDSNLISYIKQNDYKYKHVVIDKNTSLRYSSVLFYSSYSPTLFQSTVIRYPTDAEGFTWVKSFGKYEFRDIDWNKDYHTPKTFIITTEGNLPADIKSSVQPIATFMYPTRSKVLSTGEEVYQYPVTDNAYEVFATRE